MVGNYKAEILIVDDDPASLDLLSEMLYALNYEVRIANGGTMALTAIQSSFPDLVLLDINMPDLDGYEVCRRLKTEPQSQAIPVIFISASGDTFDKVQAFAMGGVDYVTKPFQLEEVLARIEAQLKIAQLSKELQLQLLRYQLNPHFLFNALMSIRALVMIDGNAAVEMITKLSDYLRYLLSGRADLEISVGEELTAAENYLAIEKIRFGDKLAVHMDVDAEIKEYLMPAFLLQPLLENAIKYGMHSSPYPLQITFTAKYISHFLCFSISNTGHWVVNKDDEIKESSSLGIGLQNVRQRLRQLYPHTHHFTIVRENGYVEVIIKFPCVKHNL